jgi:hypothetical protein
MIAITAFDSRIQRTNISESFRKYRIEIRLAAGSA